MAKPNYAYEKRQRELAKKQKKESKDREKADRKTHPEPGDAGGPPAVQTQDQDPAEGGGSVDGGSAGSTAGGSAGGSAGGGDGGGAGGSD